MKHYHFIGIGGIGMSALARILVNKKMRVSGSDASASSIVESLSKEGVTINIGHSKQNVKEGSTIVYNSMIQQENPEFAQALQLKCPILHRSDLINEIGRGYKTLAITGTHGKTTTSSLLATVLRQASMDPAYALGGLLLDGSLNGGGGGGEYFVVEADESDASFLKYPVFGAIVTNVDDDHLDYYGSKEALIDAFSKFMNGVERDELLFWCNDDAPLKKIAKRGISYGFQEGSLLKGSRLHFEGWKTVFDIEFKQKKYRDVELALIGEHQALNALAVFGFALALGIEEETIRLAFKEFKGISRRLEQKCNSNTVLILDDYAHHPTEIKTTLKGVRRAIDERRLIVVYQPHRYSRTQLCLEGLKDAFESADEVIVTDLYGAFETPIPGIDARLVVSRIKGRVSFMAKESLFDALIHKVRPHDVVVTMNAGDLCKISHEVGNYFTKNAPTKLKVAVLFGGKSSEHEISLLSAKFIIDSLDPKLYEIKELLVPKTGFEMNSKFEDIDIAIPVFHGPFGEDGTVQGFFETLNIAYVGCDHRVAAICMDKALTKRLVLSHGIKTAKFCDFSLPRWREERKEIIEEITSQVAFPIFVKPVHLGSSIGISKVLDINELENSIDYAFSFDTHVLCEESVVGREIEFAVLGNYHLFVPKPGEIMTGGQVYDYDAKYSPTGMKARVPAHLEDEIVEKGINLTKLVYKVLGCRGLARVDFFLTKEGEYLLSEVNPFPGFTSISVYPKAIVAGGISARDLLDRLIILGLQRKNLQDRHMHP